MLNEYGPLEFAKLAIFYASWLYFPAAFLLLRRIVRRRRHIPAASALLFTFLTILAYARFIEPRILLTVEHQAKLERCFPEAGSARIAVFSDTHLGLFANATPLSRIARRINAAEPDFALAPGDFVYFLSPRRYEETFAAFAEVKAPVYGVLGNHDVGLPGPDASATLRPALEKIGVHMIDDAIATLAVGGAEVEIAGLSDLWAKNQKRTLLENRGDAPRLVLTHNPSTITTLKPQEAVDLMIAGHTHGGQINIPFVTCALTFACSVTRYGFAETARGNVFVTSGTGMVGLPMRFNTPPRIDVIDLSWRACS